MTGEPLPGLVMTFYGDDFTGSTDALEALTGAGLPALVFLEPPDPAVLARRPDVRAIGVAGTSRSRSPDWMDAALPPVFTALQRLGAPLCHYKTCSTFDSAPHVGSIGRAIEIGRRVFATPSVPVVVGVPRLGRYVTFATLFARAGEEVFRIDRHPIMRRHPTTPMGEADLIRHLVAQTALPVAGLSFPELLADDAAARFDAVAAATPIVVLDTFDAATMQAAGRLLWRAGRGGPAFVAGSSGVPYAVVAHLRATGRLPAPPAAAAAGPAERLIVVSGSCSRATEAQIRWAEAQGFASIAVDGAALVRDADAVAGHVAGVARRALGDHRGVVLHTALGPDDPRIDEARAALAGAGLTPTDSAARLGRPLGRIAKDLLGAGGGRLVLAGGDSSSHIARTLGIEALEMVAPTVPGAPLCRVEAADAAVHGTEIVVKGGQVGPPDYFGLVQRGRA